jgi:hypothetical protein
MLEKYKVDLKRLEKGIEENQKLVDLHDLETERQEVIRSFNAKLAEIDTKLKNLRSGSTTQKPDKQPSETRNTNDQASNGLHKVSDNDPVQPATNDSEKRIEQIREEILKAMDRLEQIETEG